MTARESDALTRLRAALADRYAVERELGHGGTATVYLAQDLKLGRLVAIKVLRREIAAAVGAERFLREIEIAARLTHPHILALHDSGDANGLLYYVMPYVEGESLRGRLDREPQLLVAEALRITRAVAEALTYAHGHGVVHRDVKPENILLSGETVLVADFGIARAITAAGGESLTETGIAVGTPFYMSPEQAAGERQIDGRSDVYGLGCVVYEMLAGGPPFTGPSAQAIVARHALDPVPPLRTIRPELPAAVDRAVGKALAKAPADRFPTVTAFLEALTRPAVPRGGRKRLRAVLLVAGTVAALAAGYVLIIHPPRAFRAGSGPAGRSIVVLPFVNIGSDPNNEPFSDGMSEELTTALAKVETLSVTARTSAFSFKGKNIDVREIGRQLHVGYVLEGSVQRAGSRLRVTAQLINAGNGYHLWSEQYERDASDVFAVQDEITRAIVGALQMKLTAAGDAALVKPSTASPEAHDLYLQGRYFYAKRDSTSLRRAREYFELAIQKDSNYALAYDGLSDAYSHSSVFGYVAPREVYPQAKAAALRALTLDSTLVEVHTSLAFIALFLEWDWETARSELERALAVNPRYAEAHLFHGWYFVTRNRLDDAVDEVRTAVRLDPFSIVNNIRLASMLGYARRYDEAIAQLRRVQELDPTFFQTSSELARMYVQLGHCDEALAVLTHAPQLTAAGLRGIAGWVRARCGQRAAAVTELNHFRSEAKAGRYVSHFAVAVIHAGLGDTEQVFAELDSAFAEHPWAMFTLRVDPAFDGLRADPRFARLLRKVGLTP
jgi:TolB-like protein/Flp pilus assembly protein TadD